MKSVRKVPMYSVSLSQHTNREVASRYRCTFIDWPSKWEFPLSKRKCSFIQCVYMEVKQVLLNIIGISRIHEGIGELCYHTVNYLC